MISWTSVDKQLPAPCGKDIFSDTVLVKTVSGMLGFATYIRASLKDDSMKDYWRVWRTGCKCAKLILYDCDGWEEITDRYGVLGHGYDEVTHWCPINS